MRIASIIMIPITAKIPKINNAIFSPTPALEMNEVTDALSSFSDILTVTYPVAAASAT